MSDTGTMYNQQGLPLIVVDNAQCQAVIALQGAHILEFKRKSVDGTIATPLLWLSPNAIFAPGKAVRGGVPLCFPWFGPHALVANAPQHGFARIRTWRLVRAVGTGDTTELVFSLTSSSETLELYPHEFTAELLFSLGESLSFELTVSNTGTSTMPVGWALHSYFPVSDTATATVPELVGSEYLDQTDNARIKRLARNLDFSRHTDAVFTQSPDAITLVRPEGNIEISTENAPTTVVWNPCNLANTMADLGPGTQQQFVCVERGVAFGDCWQVAAGDSTRAAMRLCMVPVQVLPDTDVRYGTCNPAQPGGTTDCHVRECGL